MTDAEQMAGDEEVLALLNEAQETQATWERNQNREKPNGCWSNTILLEAPQILRILNRFMAEKLRADAEQSRADEAGRELAAIKTAAGDATELWYKLDDECIDTEACEMGSFPDIDDAKAVALIEQHVASRVAPLVADNAALRARLKEAVGMVAQCVRDQNHHGTILCETIAAANALVARERGTDGN